MKRRQTTKNTNQRWNFLLFCRNKELSLLCLEPFKKEKRPKDRCSDLDKKVVVKAIKISWANNSKIICKHRVILDWNTLLWQSKSNLKRKTDEHISCLEELLIWHMTLSLKPNGDQYKRLMTRFLLKISLKTKFYWEIGRMISKPNTISLSMIEDISMQTFSEDYSIMVKLSRWQLMLKIWPRIKTSGRRSKKFRSVPCSTLGISKS